MSRQRMDADTAETLAAVVRLLRRAAELVWVAVDATTSQTMSSPPPTTLSPRPVNSTPAMSRDQTDPVLKRTAGVPPRLSRSRARTIARGGPRR